MTVRAIDCYLFLERLLQTSGHEVINMQSMSQSWKLPMNSFMHQCVQLNKPLMIKGIMNSNYDHCNKKYKHERISLILKSWKLTSALNCRQQELSCHRCACNYLPRTVANTRTQNRLESKRCTFFFRISSSSQWGSNWIIRFKQAEGIHQECPGEGTKQHRWSCSLQRSLSVPGQKCCCPLLWSVQTDCYQANQILLCEAHSLLWFLLFATLWQLLPILLPLPVSVQQ